jgi:hypothetical protein
MNDKSSHPFPPIYIDRVKKAIVDLEKGLISKRDLIKVMQLYIDGHKGD